MAWHTRSNFQILQDWNGTSGIVFIPHFVKIVQLVKRLKVEKTTHTAWPQMFSFFFPNKWKYAKNELQITVAQINEPSKSHAVPTTQHSFHQATSCFIKIISSHDIWHYCVRNIPVLWRAVGGTTLTLQGPSGQQIECSGRQAVWTVALHHRQRQSCSLQYSNTSIYSL
jgi:hypothetical protein